MSVYQPKGTDRYVYDFVRKGRRYLGPCETTSLTQARIVERAKVAEVEAGYGPDDTSDLTIDAAAARWFDEVGQHLKSAVDLERSLDLVVMCIGPRTKLREIDSVKVSAAIETRRQLPVEFRSRNGVKTKAAKNSTINRQVVDLTRRILRRAALHWGARNLPAVDWSELRLNEGAKRQREFSEDENARLDAAVLRPYWREFRDFLGTYGLRLSEMFFTPDQVQLIDGVVRVRIRERKDGSTYSIVLLPEDGRRMLMRRSRAEAAGFTTVWFHEYRPYSRPRKRRSLPLPPAELIPLTYNGARTALRRVIKRSGVANVTIHDHRHDVATKLTRKAGIAIAQAQLGHSDISTTQRYVTVADEDLLSGLAKIKSRENSRDALSAVEKDGEKQKGRA